MPSSSINEMESTRSSAYLNYCPRTQATRIYLRCVSPTYWNLGFSFHIKVSLPASLTLEPEMQVEGCWQHLRALSEHLIVEAILKLVAMWLYYASVIFDSTP
jgi:hypothetical protein